MNVICVGMELVMLVLNGFKEHLKQILALIAFNAIDNSAMATYSIQKQLFYIANLSQNSIFFCLISVALCHSIPFQTHALVFYHFISLFFIFCHFFASPIKKTVSANLSRRVY